MSQGGGRSIPGAPGATGPQGNQGSPGATGPQGVQGSPGPTGIDGANGATGPTGPQGNQGSPGVTGPTGPQGNQGSPGVTGINAYNSTPTFRQQGLTGGNTILTGADQGWEQVGQAVFIQTGGYYQITGITGGSLYLVNLASNLPSGTIVNASKISPAGIPGVAGPTGPTGPQGPTGPTGPPGAGTGVTGPQGAQGSPGVTGPTGPAGAGATGPQGPQGSPGAPGATGPAAGGNPIYMVLGTVTGGAGVPGSGATVAATGSLLTWETETYKVGNIGHTTIGTASSSVVFNEGGVYSIGYQIQFTAVSSGMNIAVYQALNSGGKIFGGTPIDQSITYAMTSSNYFAGPAPARIATSGVGIKRYTVVVPSGATMETYTYLYPGQNSSGSRSIYTGAGCKIHGTGTDLNIIKLF